MNEMGLETVSSFHNSAGYIQNWLTVLRNDSKMIVSAAGKAEKAVRLIMDMEEQREEKAAA
jgi:antirestriction protein ArdC